MKTLIKATIFLSLLFGLSYLAPYNVLEKVNDSNLGPSFDHLMGTDKTGRDLFSLILIGFRGSVIIGVVAATVALFSAITLGLLLTKIKLVSSFIADIFILIPLTLPLLAFGERISTPVVIGLFIGIFSWSPLYGALSKQLEAIEKKQFVIRVRESGAGNFKVTMFILPLLIPMLCAYFVNLFAIAIVTDSIISFVGGGIITPNVSWGLLISNTNFTSDSWHLAFFPILAMTSLTMFCFSITRKIEKSWTQI
jgi:peptide/nickel transport system permease protein